MIVPKEGEPRNKFFDSVAYHFCEAAQQCQMHVGYAQGRRS